MTQTLSQYPANMFRRHSKVPVRIVPVILHTSGGNTAPTSTTVAALP